MTTVGRIAGVSQATVSRALSDPSRVSPETLEKIRQAIRATGFVPNAVAGALASSRSNLITALVPSITNIVYSSLIQSFSRVMREWGYQILLSETGFDAEEEEALIAAHLSRRPDAMLLTGTRHSPQARKMLIGSGIPVVEVWDITDTPIDFCVGFSHVEAGRAVARFVRELGHDRAVTVTANDERARRRRDAFAESFVQAGGTTPVAVDCPGAASLAAGRAALVEALEVHGFGRGVVFCSSDLLAHGVVSEAQVRGIAVPGDLAVVGFGDQDFAAMVEPPLTTVRVDRAELGRRAATALRARLEGNDPGETVIDLGYRIIRRGSA
ncbi:LacI family DNA-binding transcriptional regulator [Acidimangrovimonas sediminis]|uniref:LacI family DNA-binding transcriptional regulator n=1 Tax=Acidimangrovimonas sediminis TaxID=2056283 RepID=UPI000C807F29|nr:LacI family DNA-binding transcriptional regulator [Acidimangrovimonas sediminis]